MNKLIDAYTSQLLIDYKYNKLLPLYNFFNIIIFI